MSSAKTAGFFSLLLLGSVALAACQLRSQEPARLHAERSFVVHLNAPPEEVFPLFGPIGERAWAPDWSPRMIFPSDGSEPAGGAVFSTGDDHGEQTWVLTAYDSQRGEISYCIFEPGLAVSEIDIRLQTQGEAQTSAEVHYRHTSLSPHGDHLVARLAEHHAKMGPHWEHAINEVLQKRRDNVSR